MMTMRLSLSLAVLAVLYAPGRPDEITFEAGIEFAKADG